MSAERLDRETIQLEADQAASMGWNFAKHVVPRLLGDCDALAGALRESVERCRRCPRHFRAYDPAYQGRMAGPDGREVEGEWYKPSECSDCKRDLALLDRLGYGAEG